MWKTKKEVQIISSKMSVFVLFFMQFWNPINQMLHLQKHNINFGSLQMTAENA